MLPRTHMSASGQPGGHAPYPTSLAPGPGSAPRAMGMPQQSQRHQPQPHMGGAPAPGGIVQAPFKGTLAPGTRVQVGGLSVTVKRYLSEGGFAHVYLVETSVPIPIPTSLNARAGQTTHVLKRMAVPDKEALAGVRGEVEVHKLLRNQPNIVHFIEASASALQGPGPGGYEIFILMEFCAGGGIIDMMNARLRDRLREDEVLKIFGDVCSGLAVMHHLDPPLMHRDLKVENILLAPPPPNAPHQGPTYKLCDFGSAAPVLSRRAPSSLAEIQRLEMDLNRHTTLQYRAPEMVDVYQRRVIDEKADIWALGILLYKLCYYTTPFEENGGGPLAILNVQYRIPPAPVYSQRLKDLIGSLLKEQSTQRPTIDEVIIMVARLRGLPPPSSAVHYATQAAGGKQARPLPTVVSGAADSAAASAAIAAAGRAPASSPLSPPTTSNARGRAPSGDLILMGPSDADRERAEAEALRRQTEGIMPMRRGRPNKAATAGPKAADDGIVPRPLKMQLTGERHPGAVGRSGVDWTTKNGPQSGSGATSNSFADSGFGDSFVPSPSLVASAGAHKDAGAQNENTGASRSIGRPLSGASPGLSYSPALPGFNPSPSPRASPMPSPSPSLPVPSGSNRGSSSTLLEPQRSTSALGRGASPGTNDADEGASSRFPSVEELNRTYPITPTATSPPISIPSPSASTAAVSPPLALGGSSNRFGGLLSPSATANSGRISPPKGATSTGNTLTARPTPLRQGTSSLPSLVSRSVSSSGLSGPAAGAGTGAVGAITSRLEREKAQGEEPLRNGPSTTTGSGVASRRWPPAESASGSSGASSAARKTDFRRSMAVSGTESAGMHAKTLGVPPEVGDRRLKPNKSGGAFSPTSSAFGRGPEGQDQPPLPKRESESTARNAKTWLTAGTRRLKAPDWLTGDDDAEAESAEAVPGRDRKERVTPREPVSAASYTGEEPRIDEAGKEVYRSSARYRRSSSRNGSSSKEADEPVPVQQKEMDRNQSMSPLKEDWDPIAQISPDTSDVESADEAEEPEEVEGMRRYATHASTSADAGEARKAADAERAAGKVAEGQEESGKPRAGPGRVKAPSWLVDTSTERAPSKPTPSTGLDAKKPALEVEEPPSPEAQVAQVADETWERRPLAPAWDEEDADEIRALPPPRLGAGMSARDKTGTLVDVESEEREASKAYENGRVVPNRRADRLVDIDDDEVEPPKPTKPTRQMADAATSPVHPGLPVEIAPTPTPIMASSSAADRAAMVASPGPASPPPKLATPIPASPRSNRGPSDSITSIVGQYESMHVGAGPEPGSPARRPVSPSKTGRMLRSVGGPAQDETKGFQSRFPALNEPPSRERPEPEEPEEKPDRRLGGPSRGASMQPRPSSPKKADSTLPPASSSSSTAEPKSPTKRVSSFVHERQRSFGARVGDSASSPAPSPSSSPVAALAPSSPARSATQPSAGHGLRVSDRLTGVQTGSGVTPSPTPARPTPVRPTTLKPWEREAAAAAEANSSGLVRSSSFAPDTGGSGGGAQSDEAFSGVGSLINRWQATAEARGQVGRKGVQAGLNPVAAAAANAAGGTALKRASTVGGPKARLPGRET